MKYIIFILISCLSFNAFADYDPYYRVRGYDQYGQPVSGIIYTNNEPWFVEGEVINKKGDKLYFYGRWNGRGQITGQTEDGLLTDLYTHAYMQKVNPKINIINVIIDN